MIDVADVVRRFVSVTLDAHGASMLPSHRRTFSDIQACRTEVLGGLLWRCTECSAEVPSYHGCGHRSCPKCHKDQTAAWLEARAAEMLPGVVVPDAVWKKLWVVHCVPWGEGEKGVLDYLARYVFRTAITNSRITAMDEATVTFRYKQRDGGAGTWRTSTVSGQEFLRRFSQHILPRGFHKVRYYGLWHPSKRDLAARVRQMLLLDRTPPPVTPVAEPPDADSPPRPPQTPRLCPRCGQAQLALVGRLTPTRTCLPPRDSPRDSS